MEIVCKRSMFSKEDTFLIVPLFEDVLLASSGPKELKPLLEKHQPDFKAKAGETLLLFPEGSAFPKKIVLMGFGKKKDLKSMTARSFGSKIIKTAKAYEVTAFSVLMPDALAKYAQELGEGFEFGNYNLAVYQTGENKQNNEKKLVKKIQIVCSKPGVQTEKQFQLGQTIATAVNEVRDLVNAPPVLKNVDFMAKKAEQIGKQNGYKVKVFDRKQLEKMGMGAIVGVNRGSAVGAKMVVMEYNPKGSAKKQPVTFVGKGIIFDSGGYNLKPGNAMGDMQLDMAGAAAVMGLFMLLKKLQVKHPVVGIFPLTENLIGPTAQKPSDIVTTYSGKTVEITNTDAEGRLVLCDALSYAVKNMKPRFMVDLATLTGACVVALGERYAGLFGNDTDLMEKLRKAGDSVDELVWPMPVHEDYKARMKSKIADLRNHDDLYHAGASKGAAFLEYFVEDTKWAHLDIAGPAFVKEPKEYESPMATGFGVRLMLKFLQDLK